MEYLTWFIVVFSIAQLIVALINLIYSQPFSKERMKNSPLVSVLIPARNEEKNIGGLLSGLQQQNYSNIEIIVFNDLSTDKTADIVTEFANRDPRIKLVGSQGLPDGWLGKNHACHMLSGQAKGDFFLFLDADVRIAGSIITESIVMSSRYNLGLLSIFPRQLMQTVGEWLTVPGMNMILLSLLPLVLVRKSRFPSVSAANGQFMLFHASAYKNSLPHQKMKASKVEDIEIARYFKKNKIPVACLAGNDNLTCRMYEGFGEAVNGFSKNVISFFGNSFLLAALFWLVTTFGFLVVLLTAGIKIMVLYLSVIVTGRIIISVISRQNILLNLLFFLPQQLVLGYIILKAALNKRSKNYTWKGRSVS